MKLFYIFQSVIITCIGIEDASADFSMSHCPKTCNETFDGYYYKKTESCFMRKGRIVTFTASHKFCTKQAANVDNWRGRLAVIQTEELLELIKNNVGSFATSIGTWVALVRSGTKWNWVEEVKNVAPLSYGPGITGDFTSAAFRKTFFVGRDSSKKYPPLCELICSAVPTTLSNIATTLTSSITTENDMSTNVPDLLLTSNFFTTSSSTAYTTTEYMYFSSSFSPTVSTTPPRKLPTTSTSVLVSIPEVLFHPIITTFTTKQKSILSSTISHPASFSTTISIAFFPTPEFNPFSTSRSFQHKAAAPTTLHATQKSSHFTTSLPDSAFYTTAIKPDQLPDVSFVSPLLPYAKKTPAATTNVSMVSPLSINNLGKVFSIKTASSAAFIPHLLKQVSTPMKKVHVTLALAPADPLLNISFASTIVPHPKKIPAVTTSVSMVSPMSFAQSEKCTWNDWNEWSECSVTCSNGVKYRNRTFAKNQFHEIAECNSSLTEVSTCYGQNVYNDFLKFCPTDPDIETIFVKAGIDETSIEIGDSVSLTSSALDSIPFLTDFLNNSIRQKLGHQLTETIPLCSFDNIPCHEQDFSPFIDPSLGNCFTFNFMDPPKYVSHKGGINSGLSVLLQGSQPEYTCTSSTAGFRILVHNSTEFPFPDALGYNVAPGKQTSIGITKTLIKRLDSPYGDCVSTKKASNNKYLYNGSYSLEGCYKSCFQHVMMTNCKCGDPRYPLKSSQKLCTLKEKKCLDYYRNCQDAILDSENCQCKLPCQELLFPAVFSSSDLYAKEILNQACNKLKLNCTETTHKKNFALLKIYYERLNAVHYTETAGYTISQLCANFGGIIGIIFGASVAIIIEFIFAVISLCLSLTNFSVKLMQ